VVRRIGGVVVVNPGSAGEGRYTRDGLMLSCAVLDTGTGEARVIHFRDPTDAPNERQTSVTRALGPA